MREMRSVVFCVSVWFRTFCRLRSVSTYALAICVHKMPFYAFSLHICSDVDDVCCYCRSDVTTMKRCHVFCNGCIFLLLLISKIDDAFALTSFPVGTFSFSCIYIVNSVAPIGFVCLLFRDVRCWMLDASIKFINICSLW